MNKNQNIEELVSRFLEGEMTDLERINFENQLANNSNIQEEFQFQKDIIEGIKENRKAELKARLDQITIPSSNIYQYIGIKVAALITITTMIGFGAYYTFFEQEDNTASDSVITLNEANSEEVAPEVPQMPEPEIEEEMVVEEFEIETKSNEGNASANTSSGETTTEVKEPNKEEVIPTPSIVKPDAVEAIADENIDHKDDSFEVSNNSLNNIKDVLKNKVEVETISGKKRNFHYQFYNKKLFLYGDFDKTPYEILEYNADDAKLFYLYYEGKYYELNSNQMKIAPLSEIKNKDLIGELELLRD